MSLLGIDIGTSSICGVAYSPQSQALVSLTKANDSSISSSRSWEKTQDPAIIVRTVSTLLEALRSRCSDAVEGIGLTGQMHGILYVDAAGKAVSPLYTWQDDRGNLPHPNGPSYAAYLSERTGLPLSAGYGLVTHFYNQENGLVPPEAVKLCTVMDYVAMVLAGRTTPVTDESNAAGLGFFDLERRRFDRKALEKAGIRPSLLPEVVDFTCPIGAYRIGTCRPIPVYPAIGDNQASFLGSVRNRKDTIHLTVGTSSQLSVYTDTYREVPSLDTRPLPGGGYILVGAGLCGGYSFTLLKNFFADTIRFCTGEETTDDALYKRMTAVPFKEEAEGDLWVETLFNGTRRHPDKRGKIENLSLSNLTPENLIRGFLRGISRELYDFYRLLPASVRKDKRQLAGSGNGLRKNPLLCRMLEKQFELPLHISDHPEEAALGACMGRMA